MSTVAPLQTLGVQAAPPGVRSLRSASPSEAPAPRDIVAFADAPEESRGLSGWQKVGLASLGALTLVGCAGIPAAHAGPAVQAASMTREVSDTRTGVAVLRSLSERGLLFQQKDAEEPDSFGRAIDAATAKRRLDEGKPVLVQNPWIGNYKGFYTMLRPGEQDFRRNFVPQGDLVSSWGDLEKLNHAEGLTGVDTSRSFTESQKETLGLLRSFEGGVPSPNVSFQNGYFPGFYYYDFWGNYIFMNPGYYEAWQVTPNSSDPAIFSSQDKGGFLGIGAKPDRLSTYEALQDLEAGNGLKVRTDRGITHEVRNVQELRELHELEAR